MLKNHLKIIILLLPALLKALTSDAQKLSLSADTIATGNQITMTIEAETDKNVIFPVFQDTIIDGIVVVNSSPKDTAEGNKQIKRYTITAFDDSLYEIPALPVMFNTDTMYTNPVRLRVKYYIPDSSYLSQIDTTQSIPIADIDPPINTPLTFAEFWHRYGNIILIILAVILVAAIGTYVYIRIKQNKPIFLPPKPKIPAHVKALKALEEIKEEGIPVGDRLKKFYDKLSYTIRVYIEDRYQIPAPDYVSSEIAAALETIKDMPENLKKETNAMLRTADLVKFAKFRPEIYESEVHLKNAFTFVKETAEKEEIPQEKTEITPKQQILEK